MKTLTLDDMIRGCHGFKGTALALLMTMTPAWAGEMDSTMAKKLQGMLDVRAKSLNGAGMIMAVRIPGRDVWVGATGYAQRGGEVLTDAKAQPLLDHYGLPRRKGSQLMRPDDLMYVDSCSKTHIAALVMRLVAERILSLDDTLAKWLPQCQIPNAERITLRQMLNHTSGIYMLNTPEIRKYLRANPTGLTRHWKWWGCWPDELLSLNRARRIAGSIPFRITCCSDWSSRRHVARALPG